MSTIEAPEKQQPSPEDVATAKAAAQQDALRRAANPTTAKDISPTQERSVIAFLLGPPQPIDFEVIAKIATDFSGEEGVDTRFVVRTVPDPILRGIDERYTSTNPDGTQQIDAAKIAAATFWESLVAVEDPESKESVAKENITLRSPNGAPLDGPSWVALQFVYQFGIVEQIAIRVRQISGWSGDRVGRASRLAVNAALGS